MARLSVFFGTLIAIHANVAVAMTPVEAHGHLRVNGNKIVDKNGKPVQLRGMALFWSQWMGKYWNKDVMQWLASDWNVSLVRAAMGVEAGTGGYLENPEAEKAKVIAVVDAAIAAGVYVIIDWHEDNADQHLDQSKAFFNEMAEKFGAHPNVLFETFNEPTRQNWSEQIKPYHEQIVQVIRQHSDNLVILGTRTWSQEVDVASRDPVPGNNLAYTLHFYAATHKQYLRDTAQRALDNGAAIFVTEWGTCEATGDGALNLTETQAWLDFLAEKHISCANWAIADKTEACAALRPGASGHGGWSTDMLTESGAFVRNFLRGSSSPTPGPAPGPSPGPSPAWSGKCCYGGCSTCSPSSFCFETQANCEGPCHGMWCPSTDFAANSSVTFVV